jgi:hypothetical protein
MLVKREDIYLIQFHIKLQFFLTENTVQLCQKNYLVNKL